MPQHVSAFEEMERQFATEFNYAREAESMQEMYDVTMPRWKGEVCIPKPYKDLCSTSVLVMEYLDGVKLVDGVRQQYSRLAALQGTTISHHT